MVDKSQLGLLSNNTRAINVSGPPQVIGAFSRIVAYPRILSPNLVEALIEPCQFCQLQSARELAQSKVRVRRNESTSLVRPGKFNTRAVPRPQPPLKHSNSSSYLVDFLFWKPSRQTSFPLGTYVIKILAQLEAAFALLSATASEPLMVGGFEEACGIGIVPFFSGSLVHTPLDAFTVKIPVFKLGYVVKLHSIKEHDSSHSLLLNISIIEVFFHGTMEEGDGTTCVSIDP
nr:glutamine--tRNA ligase isoform X2 [Ipomoea batatas]